MLIRLALRFAAMLYAFMLGMAIAYGMADYTIIILVGVIVASAHVALVTTEVTK